MFAEWRTRRQVEYGRMNGLIARALMLARGDALIAVLAEIQELAEEMATTDSPRFLANGITETILSLDSVDKKAGALD